MKKKIIILVGVVLVIMLGVLGYLYINKNKERMEKSLVVEKMCSDMKKDELINLREKLGDSLGYEL